DNRPGANSILGSDLAAKALKEPDIRERLNQTGIEPVGNTPEQAKQFLDTEIAKWAKVINTAGVKAEQ
ncbi:MAG TPA: tripartite tricarboxylate transporter substrate-binding protein, partial [Burkholderiales bacterium]|nr:tripartite tricarboxylate transporter substrate-binding protein [Burkholderiales bacterium]